MATNRDVPSIVMKNGKEMRFLVFYIAAKSSGMRWCLNLLIVLLAYYLNYFGWKWKVLVVNAVGKTCSDVAIVAGYELNLTGFEVNPMNSLAMISMERQATH